MLIQTLKARLAVFVIGKVEVTADQARHGLEDNRELRFGVQDQCSVVFSTIACCTCVSSLHASLFFCFCFLEADASNVTSYRLGVICSEDAVRSLDNSMELVQAFVRRIFFRRFFHVPRRNGVSI